VERFATFADPNGRVLERAKEVKKSQSDSGNRNEKLGGCKSNKHIADSDDEARKFF
jgi:hypothetical protein